jgi:uncharacterized protein YwgA
MSESKLTSDQTKFYDYNEAKEIIKKLEIKQFSAKDLIFIIMFAQDKPIHGRILLMKEMFLLYKRILHPYTENPKFIPYRFGPYSFHLTEMIKTLHNDGYIHVEGRTNSHSESFSLSSKGKKYAKSIFNTIPDNVQLVIQKKRKGWDQLGVDGILNYVYTYYKDYKANSLLKNRYKDIIWGQGTG